MSHQSSEGEPKNTTSLFDEFSNPTFEDWVEATMASLKGKSFETAVSQTYEGIPLQPMYRREETVAVQHPGTIPGQYPFGRGSWASGYLERPWLIAQELAYPTPALFNEALLADMERGQTAVNLCLDAPTRTGLDPDQAQPGAVGKDGVSIASRQDMSTTLAGIDLARTPIFINAGAAGLPMLAFLIAHLGGQSAAELHGCLEMDPLGILAQEGTLPLSLPRAYDEMAQVTTWAAVHAPKLDTIAIHTVPYHNGGAHAVQELAYAIATGVEYIRALQERGLSIDTIASRMQFHMAIGNQFFMEIAKLRAARMVWAQVVSAFGGKIDSQKMRLHGRTAVTNKTIIDPHVNMLRATTDALAGAAGGVDSMHIAPFDEAIGLPDEFSRRIARNVHLILQEEASLTRVIDPAGGSWYVETLTKELGQKAWQLFQEIERRDGMLCILQDGFPQIEIEAVAAERVSKVAMRRDVLVGANMYPNPSQEEPASIAVDYQAIYRKRKQQIHQNRQEGDPVARTQALAKLTDMALTSPDDIVAAAIEAAVAGATMNEITQALRIQDGARPTIDPIKTQRLAKPFEALRRRAADFKAQYGRPPQIFCASIGPLRDYKARADFAAEFFAAGGIELLQNDGFDSPDVAAQAAIDAQAPAVLICAPDDRYPEIVPLLIGKIRAERPDTIILLAGYPKEQIEAHKAAGIDGFIYLGANCYEINLELQEMINLTG